MSRLAIAGFILVVSSLGRPASAEPCTERDAGAVSRSFPGALVLACGPALRDGRAVRRVEAATADGRKLVVDLDEAARLVAATEGLTLASVPEEAVRAAGDAHPGATLAFAERVTAADGRRSFALTLSDGKSELRLEFDEAWKPLEPR